MKFLINFNQILTGRNERTSIQKWKIKNVFRETNAVILENGNDDERNDVTNSVYMK